MGSVFVKKKDVFIIDPITRKEIQTPFYIQFVPGVVDEVMTSTNDKFGSSVSVNTIKAVPHILSSDTLLKNRATTNENDRYIPLFRGMVDAPAKGDPVLLCTIGKKKYYLGPLNTDNNVCWNNDNLQNWNGIDTSMGPPLESDVRESTGQSSNFQKSMHSRLQKINKLELDGEMLDEGEIHGDLMFEGRHGNSIRIGSRNVNPYIFISNERGVGKVEESIVDGSLISITSNGTLQQHFGGYEDTVNEGPVPGFQLASDGVVGNGRTIGSMIQSVNTDDNSYTYLYDFGNTESTTSLVNGTNQILFHSDRIIINSKKNDIFISSINDIHLGTGRNLTISTKEDLIIESRNIYLGSPIKNKSSVKMEPMVLGETLFELLEELTDNLSRMQGMSLYAPGPPVDIKVDGLKPIKTVFDGIKKKLLNIKSNYHYIEPNDTTSK
jgi:hypothetical protein